MLEKRTAELNGLYDRISSNLESAAATIRKQRSSLEEVRERCNVLEQTIETLVASHKLLLERYDAETALQVRLKTAASVRE